MEFRVLGPLEVSRDGLPLDVRGTKRRAVLALLVLRANEVVGGEHLVAELWGEQRPANASGALYNHVSRLRKDLGSDVLVTKAWGYVLRVDRDAVDLHRFNDLVAEAASLPARERAAKLAEALALWRGPALADLADEPAVAFEAARLDELRLAAIEQRIDAELELGAHVALVPELEALIAAHPLRERMRGQLILALYRSGRQAEALEVYRETRRVLVEELGLEPTPELRELEQAILRQDASLAPPPVTAVPAGAPPPRRTRTTLLALALLVPLFAAGIAAALLMRTSAETRAEKTTTAPPAVVPPLASTKAVTHTTTLVRTTEPKTVSTRPARHNPAVVVTSSTVRPQTTTHVPSTTISRPRAVTTAPSTATTTAAAHWAWVMTDTFDDDSLTGQMWRVGGQGDGLASYTTAGRLEFQIKEDASPPLEQRYVTSCFVIDDFDAQVDFQLLDWPASDGIDVALGAVFSAGPDEALWTADRSGGSLESYSGLVRTSSSTAETEDLSGTLRLMRAHGVLSAYYRGRRGWVRTASGRESRFANLVLAVRTAPAAFGHHAARVAFDNFRATAPNVFCAGPYYAPRKLVRP